MRSSTKVSSRDCLVASGKHFCRVLKVDRQYYLESSKQRTLPRPMPVRTKFYNFMPSIGIIFRTAWSRAMDDPILSYYFRTAPFPVWANHPNLKNILSYKNKVFSGGKLDRKCSQFKFQKFNRPTVRKRCNTI